MFTQTYGQPLRVGKWQPGASEQDKATLFRAVANIAGDCAALIPDTMSIDFIESKSIGQSGDLYEKRVNHLDQQISKAVLGQTATTDAIAGGHAVGREHRLVQEDIEGADASALSAIINRDVIRPWIQLEFGPQKRYPRIRIGRPKTEDLSALATAVDKMVRLGMEIEEGEIRARFGFSEPKPGARLLRAAAPVLAPDPPDGAGEAGGQDRTSKIKRVSGEIKRGQGLPGTETALQARGPSAAISGGPSAATDPAVDLADQLARAAPPVIDGMIGQIELMMTAASSLEEFRQMLLAGFPGLDAQAMAQLMAEAFLTADLAGRL
ncbi:phage portal protein family protein, partial [Gemmobacter caeni]